MKKQICIIGAGKIGTTLGVLLKRAGYKITSVSSRSDSSCEQFMKYVKMGKICSSNKKAAELGQIIFITTNDDNIEKVSKEISDSCRNKLVVHCSGAFTTNILKCPGAKLASIHPMQAVSCPEKGIKSLPGSYFDVQCSDFIYSSCKNLVHDMGGIPVRISKKEKIINHIASCMVSNYSVALFNIAMHLYQNTNMNIERAEKMLMPLFKQNVENIKKAGAVKALTGPIERGDIETVKKHLKALEKIKWIKALYICLGRSTLKIAEKKGLEPKKARKIKKLLKTQVNRKI